MFSLQLHLAMDSPLGSRLPLLQHLIGAAIVNSLRGHEQYGVSEIITMGNRVVEEFQSKTNILPLSVCDRVSLKGFCDFTLDTLTRVGVLLARKFGRE